MPRSISQRTQLLALAGALLCLGTLAVSAAPAAATTAATVSATSGTLNGWSMMKVSDPAATNGSAVEYEWPGTVNLTVKLPADSDAVNLRVRGDQCGGAPAYTLSVDGATVASDSVSSTTWTTRSYSTALVAGTHTIAVTYTNDYTQPWPNACDRNLYLDAVGFTSNAPLKTNPAIPAGFVHQRGTSLLDGAGRPIRLHGVNIGGWLSWEGWIWGQGFDYIGESAMMQNLTSLVGSTQAQQFQSNVYANALTPSDFHAMSVDGFNVVRVPFNYRMLEDDAYPFVYKQSAWDVLDRVIQEAKQANVYVILDMQVAPCSQMYAFISDYVGGPFLWSSQQCQDRMVAMWKAIAARYSNENAIAGYDILNETIIGDAQLLALYKRVTAAIRQVDRNHLLIYEGNNMARTFTLFTQPLDANEMLSFHDYPWAFLGQDLTTRMPGYDAAAKLLNAPQYAGEFGQSSYSDDQHYVTTFNNDANVAAWTEFTWKQAPGYAAMQNIQESPNAQLLINWMNKPSRTKPTLAQATQGMNDFLNEIRFENTLPDATLRGILASPAPPPVVSPTTQTTTTTTKTTTTTTTTKPTTTTTPVRRRAGARIARCLAAAKPRWTRGHQRSTRTRRAGTCQWMASVKWDHRVARG